MRLHGRKGLMASVGQIKIYNVEADGRDEIWEDGSACV